MGDENGGVLVNKVEVNKRLTWYFEELLYVNDNKEAIMSEWNGRGMSV